MKILYTTDLHGRDLYYNLIFKKAQCHEADLVINGGDLLPKVEPVFKRQQKYIKYLARTYFPRWEKAGIHYILCPGNDDARVFDDLLAEACSEFEYVHFLRPEGDMVSIGDLDFIGFNLVCDYPFGIKDRCRMDKEGFEFPPQRGTPSYTVAKGNGYGWQEIDDWFSHARTLPTLEDELEALVKPDVRRPDEGLVSSSPLDLKASMKKAVYIMHMPPAGLGLDVCSSGDRPAAWSVREFLEREQPLLSLHGHIHESYIMTSIWKAKIGDTWAVQPGQGGPHPVYCVIDTDDLESMRRVGHKSERLHLTLDSFVQVDELPDYLQYYFSIWLAKNEMEGGKEVPFPHFERFVLEKGLNIKLIRK
ncbi:MAG: metallophosphoesterase [Desulfobacter sp.]|nr:MAG: metallophosphoesterase [Desulfobacter sp.]